MDKEELKKQLLADLAETKRLAAETREMADAMEAGRLRPGVVGGKEPSLAEMRTYIDKVKKEIEEQRTFRSLPWWKRLFRNGPALS